MGKPSKLRRFFAPSPHASFALRVAPYAVLIVLGMVVFLMMTAGWSYTNSSSFCGTTCHTMPPQYSTYLHSPHSRVDCVECHIGRDSLNVIATRKIEHSETVYAMLFNTYRFPIVAHKMRPANEACETCHLPTQFSADSLHEVRTHANDEANTPLSTFLLLKSGGGAKRQGLGRGIHWHIANKVTFLATDELEQNIPYIRVEYDDGTVKEFRDVDTKLTNQQVDTKQLKQVDCITCHNRISHNIPTPEEAVDSALYSGALSNDIPYLRQVTVQLLRTAYSSQAEAETAFKQLAVFYQQKFPPVYAEKQALIQKAVDFLKSTYAQTHFSEQKLDWRTHPNNTGHSDSAGCFRCHDGKHLSTSGESIRLECNLCHSVPQVANPAQFVSTVSIVRGAEPGSHTHSSWIALHGKAIDPTCARCHPPVDSSTDWTQLNGQKPQPDGSFCGNSACHQSDWKFAGFDSPEMQSILKEQLEQARKMNQAP